MLNDKIILAVCEEETNGYTMYPLYVVNNSDQEIEELIIISPGAYKELQDKKRTGDIEDKMIDGVGVKRYINIPSKSYFEVTKFYDWDFDWSNSRKVLVKLYDKDESLYFYMEKLFICQKKVFINVLNRKGWICYSEKNPPNKLL